MSGIQFINCVCVTIGDRILDADAVPHFIGADRFHVEQAQFGDRSQISLNCFLTAPHKLSQLSAGRPADEIPIGLR